jgi:UDP-glucose 4-epimerase
VRILDNFSTGLRSNLASFGDHVEVVEGDLRSYERVWHAVRGCEVVFHQGALPSVPRSVQDPITSNEVNVTGTVNVLLTARDAEVRRLVFASSSSVYGEVPGLPRVETQPVGPMAPYAVSKLAAEQYCRSAHRVYGLETVCLRYFNVFGQRQDPTSEYSAVIPRFVARIRDGISPTIFDNGEQSRDFTHVSNIVAANLLAVEAPDAGGQVFNIAAGESHSVNKLVETLSRLMGVDVSPEYAPPRAGDIRHSWADISLAAEVLGYQPTVGFEDGLARTIDYYETLDPRLLAPA